MRQQTARSLLFLAALSPALLGCAATAPGDEAAAAEVAGGRAGCAMAREDAAWLERAIAAWRFTAREKLLLGSPPLPSIVVADARCSYLSRQRGGRLTWSGRPHQGTLEFPDGTTMPIGVMSFTRSVGEGESGYFVMTLPSVWRAGGVSSALGLENLMIGVLLHEMMHAFQLYYATPTLAEITRLYSLPDTIGDDSLQETFSANPTYVADYMAERDLLYRAAAAPTEQEARQLASEALSMIRARRARWFTGTAAHWAPLDEVFLTMEGVGQWAMYAWHIDPRGGRTDPRLAMQEVRRGGRYWTQDEGLGLFLVIDRLLPRWQRMVFAPRPVTATELLERALMEERPKAAFNLLHPGPSSSRR